MEYINKEVAEVAAYIHSKGLYPANEGTFFQTHDRAMELAEKFQQRFPDVEWGVDLEWDETVEAFCEAHDDKHWMLLDENSLKRMKRGSFPEFTMKALVLSAHVRDSHDTDYLAVHAQKTINLLDCTEKQMVKCLKPFGYSAETLEKWLDSGENFELIAKCILEATPWYSQ